MNENVKINMIDNYFALYYLKSEENYKKLEKVIGNKEYFIYIFYLFILFIYFILKNV